MLLFVLLQSIVNNYSCSTISVQPASELVNDEHDDRVIIICNKQPTAKDDIADIRCFGSISQFLAAVLEVGDD